jgi:peptidoglycan hydrolase-like protein with peptidoglycan-binding domain
MSMSERSLDAVYNEYCGVQADLEALSVGAARYRDLQAKRDELWDEYVNGGGARIPWHKRLEDVQYQDDFEIMRHGYTGELLTQLRAMLGLPLDAPDNTPYFLAREQSAVEAFQDSHHLPVTGVVDRVTWSALVAEGAELFVPDEVSYEVATAWRGGGVMTPTPLRLRAPERWQFLLEPSARRTFVNQHNMAILATLAYDPVDPTTTKYGPTARDRLRPMADPRYREDSVLRFDDDRWMPVVTASGSSYEYGHLLSSDTDTQGFVIWNQVHTVIALRGTEGKLSDIQTDLSAKPRPWMFDGTFDAQGNAAGKLGLRTHAGFCRAFESVREQLLDTLITATKDSPTKPIFLTGHSLGAAFACLAACYLLDHPTFGRHPIHLYNFAQPRVGNAAFARHYWTERTNPRFQYFRMAHMFDPVTMVPSAILAGDVEDGIDTLMLWMGAAGLSVAELYNAARPALKPYIRKQLEKACPPEVDYRHFGVPVWQGVNEDDVPFLVEHPQSVTMREIESAESVKVRSIWDEIPLGNARHHRMGSYFRALIDVFERNAKRYLAGRDAVPPLSEHSLEPLVTALLHRHNQGFRASNKAYLTRRELRECVEGGR